jgi:hypothetical protein
MKKILMVFIVVNTICVTCKKDKGNNLPDCLKSKIEQIKSQNRWNPPAEIREYVYNGKTVYLISANCCDQYDTLIDASCKYICAPGGGIANQGDGKCTDFYKMARYVKVVWRDER